MNTTIKITMLHEQNVTCRPTERPELSFANLMIGESVHMLMNGITITFPAATLFTHAIVIRLSMLHDVYPHGP